MKDLKKMMEDKSEMDSDATEMKAQMKMKGLKELSKEMAKMSGSSLMEAMQPKKAVTVAADSEEGLEEGLEKAKDMLEEMPEEESEDMDLDSLSADELKAMIKKMKMKE